MGELYGETNIVSGEWTDGLVPTIIRAFVSSENASKKWCCFDGPIDALWIESMNTVLDDNKTLCLVSGERIKLPDTLSMIFEVNDLSVASPATVSRCGMVYMEEVHLPWKAVVKSWVQKVNAKFANQGTLFEKLFTTVVEPAIDFVQNNCKIGYQCMNIMLVQSCMTLLDAYLKEDFNVSPGHPAIATIMKLNFCFAVIWSIGGNIHDSSLDDFSDFLRPLLTEVVPDFPQ